jgi:histone acetyltransferase 1
VLLLLLPRMQFEDPSPDLQLLREKMELEMMAACPWLSEPAQAALDAAAAAAAGEQAAGGGATSTANTQPQKPQQQENKQPQQQDGQKQQQQPGGAAAEPSKANGAAAAAAAADAAAAPAKLLAMPPDLQRRATKELKIHKHQVGPPWCASGQGLPPTALLAHTHVLICP